MALSELITSYLSPMPMERQILLAKQALSKTYFGQKGLIEPVEVDGKLKFRSTYVDSLRLNRGQSARLVTDSLEDAVQYLSGFGATELADIAPGSLGPAEYRDYAQVLKDINKKLGFTGDQQYGAQIIIHKAKVGSQSIPDFLKKMKEQGTGLVFPTDDGAMALNLRQGDRVLSMQETLETMSKSGKPLFTPGELDEAIKGGNEGLSKLFAKLPKRLKGVLSPREISISGDLMQSFLGTKIPLSATGAGSEQIMKQLSEATLNIDNVFETMALAFGRDTSLGKSVKQQDVAAYVRESFEYEGGRTARQEANKYVDEVLDEIIASKKLGSKSAEIKSSLRDLISEAIRTGDIDAAEGRYGIEQVKNLLKNESDKDTKNVLKGLFSELEKGRDGSSLVNVKYAKRLRENLQEELLGLTQNRDEQSMIRKVELRRQIAEISIGKDGEAIGLSQGSVRGSVRIGGIDYSYKTAAQFKKFSDRFDKYGIITAISGLKKETGIAAGTPIVNFSGLAEATSRVYTDPMLVAFHNAAFGSEEDKLIAKAHSKNVLDEFQAVLSSGRLKEDSEVLRAIRKGAELDIDDFMEHQQFSKMMSRDFQQRILDLHNSGISINDSPEYMNLLSKWYQSELYKTKNGQKLPVVGDVYRFALNSEANAMTGTTGRKILSGKPISIKIGEAGNEISADIARIRVSNHNILFSEGDIRKFYHALGGFDLDDKGLPILGTYMSEGKRKLAAAIVRQPTSMGEVIGLTRFDDIESYREVFGKNRFFMDTLGKMAEEDSKYKVLSSALDGTGMSDDLFNPNTMGMLEQLTIDVNDRVSGAKFDDTTGERIAGTGMRDFNRNFFEKLGVLKSGENTIENFSATKLIALGNEDPALMSLGFQRLEAKIADMPLESSIFSNLDDTIDARKKTGLGKIVKELETQRKNLSNLGGKDLDDSRAAISDLSQKFYDEIENLGLNTEQKAALYGKTFINKSIDSAIANKNILGQYVNRATVVGHGLRQIEDMLGAVPGIEQDLLNKKLLMGFPSAESVIDMTQTFTSGEMNLFPASISSSRQLMQHTARTASMGTIQSEQMLKAIYGESTNLNEMGNATIEQYGKMFGYLRQKHKLDGMDPSDKRKALVLDEAFLTSGKMNQTDLVTFAKSLSEGMALADPNADISDISAAAQSNQFEQVEQLLRAKGIIAKGSVSEMVDIANASDYYLNAKRRLSANSQISREQELASRITQRSQVASEKILDENAALIKSIQDLGSIMDKDGGGEMAKIEMEIRKMQLGDKLLEGVQDVQRSMGISGYEMTNALQYSGIKKNIDIDFFTKLPDSSMRPDGTSANLFQRYMKISQEKSIYEKQTRNLELRQYIDNIFGGISDTQKAGILDEGLDLNFAEDFFGTSNNSSVISSLIKGQAPERAANMEEQRIATALKSKTLFEQTAQADKEAAAFLNGDLASSNILRTADDITDQTSSIVADTLRDLSGNGESTSSATAYKRINKQYLAEQFGKSNVRNAAIGTGLAIAASFLYQNKKDHTQEDISGPPLLPGGSAYESDYPRRSPEVPQARGQGYTAGMNYRVSLFGDRDQIQKFSTAASGLTNGSINSTMYNRIPDVARDPYQSMARSY